MDSNVVVAIVTAGSMLIATWMNNRSNKNKRVQELQLENKNLQEEQDTLQNSKIEDMEKMMLVNNKQSLYDYHERYMKLGYLPRYLKETVDAMYTFYHNHGENGTGTKMYKDLMGLPESKLESK